MAALIRLHHSGRVAAMNDFDRDDLVGYFCLVLAVALSALMVVGVIV